jgi:hypothetical protein
MPRPQQEQPVRDMRAADAANGEPDAQEQKPSVERALRGDAAGRSAHPPIDVRSFDPWPPTHLGMDWHA